MSQPNPRRNELSYSTQSNNQTKNSSKLSSSQQNAVNQQYLKNYRQQNILQQQKANQKYRKQSYGAKYNQSQSNSSQQGQYSQDKILQIIQQNRKLKQDQKSNQKQIRNFLQQGILDQDKIKFFQERQKKYSSRISELQMSNQQLLKASQQYSKNSQFLNQLKNKNQQLQRKIQELQSMDVFKQDKLNLYIEKYKELFELSITTSDKYQTQLINLFNKVKYISSQFQKYKGNLINIISLLPKQQQMNSKTNEFNTKLTNIKNTQIKIKQILNLILFKNQIQNIVDPIKLQDIVAQTFKNLCKECQLNIQNTLNKQNQLRKSIMKGMGLNMFLVLEELKNSLRNQEVNNIELNYSKLLHISEYLMKRSE